MSQEKISVTSPEVQRLKAQQEWALDAMVEVRCYPERYETTEAQEAASQTAQAAYDQTVEALVALLGPEAQCADVDADLFQLFWDCHKDDVGFRPRYAISRPDVLDWFERRRADQVAAAAALNTGKQKRISPADLPKAPPNNLLGERLAQAMKGAAC